MYEELCAACLELVSNVKKLNRGNRGKFAAAAQVKLESNLS